MTPSPGPSLPMLTLLLSLPVLGVVATLAAPTPRAAVGTARQAAALTLAVAVWIVLVRDPSLPGPQLVEHVPWLPAVGAAWHVGVDGWSAIFLPLTALLGLGALATVDPRTTARPVMVASSLLVLTTALLGVYVALDALLFFSFWELGLPPLMLLLALGGGGPSPERLTARVTMTLLLGGLPLLLGLLVLAHGPDGWTTDLVVLAAHPRPLAQQQLALGLILLGLAVKAPIPPLHGWMLEAVGDGPAAAGVMVIGLKIGAWALLRVAAPTCPDAFAAAGPALVALGSAASLYAALLAWRQTQLRRVVAWVGVSHVGAVVAALGTGDALAKAGAWVLLVDVGLTASALVALGAAVHQRAGGEDLSRVRGLATATPRLSGLLVVAALLGAGLPGGAAFVGEWLVSTGLARTAPWALALTLPAAAVGALALGRQLAGLLGGVPTEAIRGTRDASQAEALPVLALLALALVIGLAPELPLTRLGPVPSSDAAVVALPSSPLQDAP